MEEFLPINHYHSCIVLWFWIFSIFKSSIWDPENFALGNYIPGILLSSKNYQLDKSWNYNTDPGSKYISASFLHSYQSQEYYLSRNTREQETSNKKLYTVNYFE